MTSSRRLPKFDAASFESLSHEEKLKLLNDFLEALDPARPARDDVEKAGPQARRAHEAS